MRNPHFRENEQGEQDLVEDLTIEIIKTMGRDVIYIPRKLMNKDKLFGEDTTSKFDDGYPIEMYIQSVAGFEGDGDVLSKFGVEIKDKISFLVSRKRFVEEIGSIENTTRPREGDLIYLPISNSLFEINFVEHENPFYQLGKLYIYRVDCELFTYSHEDFDTGYSNIDATETSRETVIGGITIQTDPESGEEIGDNQHLENLKTSDNIFDFTDSDPFSEGDY